MERRKYSRLIAGTMTWGAWGKQLNNKKMIELIHHCMANGITSFDHADIYGGYTTEAEFGSAFAQSGIDREKIQLISKCGIQLIDDSRKTEVKHYNYSKDYIIKSTETSLQNLKTDYLDLLLLHRPSPLMKPAEIAEAITLLMAQGKIKRFGVSNFTVLQMELISKYLNISANQIECSLTADDALTNGILDKHITENITTMAWSPLGTVFRAQNKQTNRIHKLLNELSKSYQATKDQLVLAWLLKHPSNIHPVLGTTTKERITNSAEALHIDLSLEDWFKIWEASVGAEAP